jgi:hypothetical protein
MKKFKLAGLWFIITSLFCVIMNGCATTPSTPPGPIDPRMLAKNERVMLTINSFAAPDAKSKGKVYYITSAIQNVIDDDLEFQEIAGYLENSLIQNGLTRTNNRKEADILIRLGYGIGNPKTTSETYTTSTGYSYPVGWMWFTVPPRSETVTNTAYMRTMIVEAYDLKDPNRKSQLWKTTVQSEGTSSDLRVILPYMIAGSMVEIGTNTGQQKTVNISGHHPNIFYILKTNPIAANNFTGRKAYTFANGDKYEGDFVNGKRTGKGTYTCRNGKQFTGNFENDKPIGFTINCTPESFYKDMAQKMANLPLDSAIKIGNGGKNVVVFTDPNCSHCRKAYKFFSQREDVTMNIFFFPLSKESGDKIKQILCSKDVLKTYDDVMNGKLDNNAQPPVCTDKKVNETIKTHMQLAKQIGLKATPLFYIKGNVVEGFDAPVIEKLLSEAESK